MEPISIVMAVGVFTLVLERLYSLLKRWRKLKSSCCFGSIELDMRNSNNVDIVRDEMDENPVN